MGIQPYDSQRLMQYFVQDNGWTIYNPDADRETYYSEAYQALGIDPANGYEITAMQDKRFSNCYNEDNVSVLHAYGKRH